MATTFDGRCSGQSSVVLEGVNGESFSWSVRPMINRSFALCCDAALRGEGRATCWEEDEVAACCSRTSDLGSRVALCGAGCKPGALRALLSAFLLGGPAILAPGDDGVSVARAILAAYPPPEERPDRVGELAVCLMDAALFPEFPFDCDRSLVDSVEGWVDVLESPWPVFGWAHAASVARGQCWKVGKACGDKDDSVARAVWWGIREQVLRDVMQREESFAAAFRNQNVLLASVEYFAHGRSDTADFASAFLIKTASEWPDYPAMVRAITMAFRHFAVSGAANCWEDLLALRAPVFISLHRLHLLFWRWFVDDALALEPGPGAALAHFVKNAMTSFHGDQSTTGAWVAHFASLLAEQAGPLLFVDAGARCNVHEDDSADPCCSHDVASLWGCGSNNSTVLVLAFDANEKGFATVPSLPCIQRVRAAVWNASVPLSELPGDHPLLQAFDHMPGEALPPATTVDDEIAALPDSFSTAATLLKIDVQGAEYAVLQGAQKLLAAPQEVVLVLEYADLWRKFHPFNLSHVADELARAGFVPFFLGKDEALELPAVRGFAARKFDAAHVKDMALTGLRGRYFDVAFVRNGSAVERALQRDPRVWRVRGGRAR